MTSNSNPVLSIGLPVYNGEKFIKICLDSIIIQTFKDFELIISDNCSTDRTYEICKEYVDKDKRIKLFRQQKNMGSIWNFNFVLNQARGEFFAWTAVDDILLPSFFEKNINKLIEDKTVVCSTSQVQSFGAKTDSLIKKSTDTLIQRVEKRFRKRFVFVKNYSAIGNYEENIRSYLKLRGHQHLFYGVYRTEQLKKFFVFENITGFDWATMLNGLKYGKYFVLADILSQRYDGGESSHGLFKYAKSFNLNKIDTIFLYWQLTRWCFRHLGPSLFFRNLDCFVKLNLEGAFYLLVDIIRWSKKTMLRK